MTDGMPGAAAERDEAAEAEAPGKGPFVPVKGSGIAVTFQVDGEERCIEKFIGEDGGVVLRFVRPGQDTLLRMSKEAVYALRELLMHDHRAA